MENQLTNEQIEDIKKIKLFTIIEYLEQQIQFIAENHKEVYLAYQSSKQNKTKIESHEEFA